MSTEDWLAGLKPAARRPGGGKSHFKRSEIIDHAAVEIGRLILGKKSFLSRDVYSAVPAFSVLADAKALGDAFGAAPGGLGLARSRGNAFLASRENLGRVLLRVPDRKAFAAALGFAKVADLYAAMDALQTDFEIDPFFSMTSTKTSEKMSDQEKADIARIQAAAKPPRPPAPPMPAVDSDDDEPEENEETEPNTNEEDDDE